MQSYFLQRWNASDESFYLATFLQLKLHSLCSRRLIRLNHHLGMNFEADCLHLSIGAFLFQGEGRFRETFEAL